MENNEYLTVAEFNNVLRDNREALAKFRRSYTVSLHHEEK